MKEQTKQEVVDDLTEQIKYGHKEGDKDVKKNMGEEIQTPGFQY